MFSFSPFCYAQYELKGSVNDVSNGEAIRGAEIYVKGTKSGTLTDIAGFFSLKLTSPPPYKVIVRAYEYQEQEIEISNIEVERHILLYPRLESEEKPVREAPPLTSLDGDSTQSLDSIPLIVDSLVVDSLALSAEEPEKERPVSLVEKPTVDSVLSIEDKPELDSLQNAVDLPTVDTIVNIVEGPDLDTLANDGENLEADTLLTLVEKPKEDTLISAEGPKVDTLIKNLEKPQVDSLSPAKLVQGNDSIPSFMGRKDANNIPGFVEGQKLDSLPQSQSPEKLTFSKRVENFKKDLPKVSEKNDKYRLTLKIPWQKKSYDIPFPKGFTRQPNPPPYDPAVAWQRSLIFPGWGQAYNRSYWKIPFFYAGYGGFVWWINFNNVRYRRFGTAYLLAIDGIEGNEDTELSARFDPEGLRTQRNQYRSRRDNAYLLLAGWHVIQMAEAYVHAHLRGFDVSEDLSMKVVPDMLEVPGGSLGSPFYPGLSLKLKF